MNLTLYWEGTDITNEVIAYERQESICESTGTINVEIKGNSTRNFQLYDTLILYENSVKKATYKVSSIDKSLPTYTMSLQGTNSQKDLFDCFIVDKYDIAEYLSYKTRYWIEKFMTEAGVSYSFDTVSDGEYLPSDLVLGSASAGDIVKQLLQYSGWYLRYDADGVVIIGNLDYSSEDYSLSISDTTLLNINIIRDNSILRNRAVVWGKGIPDSTHWVFADITVPSSFTRDANDIRTVLISNHMIESTLIANQIALKALNEFSKIKNEKRLKIAGTLDIALGDRVYVNSKYFKGTGLVTSIEVQMSREGHTTYLILDQRCPRLIGYLNYNDGYIYVGTTGAGVWRKTLNTHVWSDFSSGITDLNIIDLDVNNGVYACVASGGYLYTRYLGDTSWTKFNLIALADLEGISYTDIECVACVIDRQTNNILAAYNRSDCINEITNGYYQVTDSGRSWLVTLEPDYSYSNIQVTWSGEQNIAILDIENTYESTMVACLAYPSGTYGEGLGTRHYQPYKDTSSNLFSSIENMYVYSGSVDYRTISFEDYSYYKAYEGIYGEYIFGHIDILVAGQQVTKYLYRYNYITNTYNYLDVESFIATRCVNDIDPPYSGPYRSVIDAVILSGTELLFYIADSQYIKDETETYYLGSITTQYFCIADFYSSLCYEKATHYTDTTSRGSENYAELFNFRVNGVSKTSYSINVVSSWNVYRADSRDSVLFNIYNTYFDSFSDFLYGPSGTYDDYDAYNLFDMGEGYVGGVLQSYQMYNLADITSLTVEDVETPSYSVVINTINKTITYYELPYLVHDSVNVAPLDYFYTGFNILDNNTIDSKAANFKSGFIYVPATRITCLFEPGPYGVYSASYIKISRNGTNEAFDIAAPPRPNYVYGRPLRTFGKNNLCVLSYIRQISSPSHYEEVVYDMTRQTEIYSRDKETLTSWVFFGSDDYTPRILAASVTVSGASYVVDNYFHTITLDYDIGTNSYSTEITEDILAPVGISRNRAYSNRINLTGEIIIIDDLYLDNTEVKSYITYVSGLVLTEPTEGIDLNPLFKYKGSDFTYLFEIGCTDLKLDAAQTAPTVIYGGNRYYNNGYLTIVASNEESYSTMNLISSGIMESGVLAGSNFITDMRTFRELQSDGAYVTRGGFLSDTVNDYNYSHLRIIDYGYNSLLRTYTYLLEESAYTFSGTANHFETTNTQENPYMFISIEGSPPQFYQRDSFDADAEPNTFVDRSSGLPSNAITIIRTDDTL